MTVILVLLTFLAFVLLDVILSRRPAAVRAAVAKAGPVPSRPDPQTDVVEGFRVSERCRYHPGHAWLLPERKHVLRVGMDEFAAALAGAADKIELPKPGHWVRQGQRAWTLHRQGERAEMLSPVEGEVVEVNAQVLDDPGLVRKDPYGEGWLFTVFAPDEESSLKNLVPKGLVRSWMRDAAERLYALQPSLVGPVAAEGGLATVDVYSGISSGLSWSDVARDFFLS
jgi:glycine cleavage system H protein